MVTLLAELYLINLPFADLLSGAVPESGSRSVAVALLAHLRRAHDHIDRNYREPLDLQITCASFVTVYCLDQTVK